MKKTFLLLLSLISLSVMAQNREKDVESCTSIMVGKKASTIPQVKHTYKYLDTAYPCMNEDHFGLL